MPEHRNLKLTFKRKPCGNRAMRDCVEKEKGKERKIRNEMEQTKRFRSIKMILVHLLLTISCPKLIKANYVRLNENGWTNSFTWFIHRECKTIKINEVLRMLPYTHTHIYLLAQFCVNYIRGKNTRNAAKNTQANSELVEQMAKCRKVTTFYSFLRATSASLPSTLSHQIFLQR